MLTDTSLAIQGNGLSPQSLELMSPGMQRLAGQEIEKVITYGMTVNTREQVRSMLATTALQNVSFLSAMEEHISLITPHAQHRCQRIVDAYTLGAANVIARW